MANVLVLQHSPEETLGSIADALTAAGHTWRYLRPYAGDAVPAALDTAGLVVMGGPMSVYETSRYPFLSDELRLIAAALDERKPILGVCLGSQLLASALGARVYAAPAKEIGWYPVQIHADMNRDPLFGDFGHTFVAFHWHGDTFDLPKGACELGHSERTLNQGFRYGANAYALQFHLEMTNDLVDDMLQSGADELAAAGVDRQAVFAGKAAHIAGVQTLGARVFGAWAALLR